MNWGLFTGPEVHSPGIISKKTQRKFWEPALNCHNCITLGLSFHFIIEVIGLKSEVSIWQANFGLQIIFGV